MAISQHTRFEDHMDVTSPETMGDAEKISDFFDEDPYDDEFEAKLSQVDKKEQDNSDISPEGNSSIGTVNSGHHYSVQQVAEKVVAVATAIDAVGDILSGGTTAIAQPNKININEVISPISMVSDEGHHDTRTVEGVIEDLGFEMDAIIDAGQAIESIGSDGDNQAEFVDERSRSDMGDDSEDRECLVIADGGDPPNPHESGVDLQKDVAYRAIVDANPEYGEGGGVQYFIPHAYDIKQEGRLKPQNPPEILEFNEKDVFKADIRDSQYSEHKIHLDKRKFLEEDVEEITDSLDHRTSGELSEVISDDELKYLDENTIATEGITDTRDRFFINKDGERESHEDYFRPHGNQEDAGGKTMPDSWSNPKELEEGKIYYQLSPFYSDGNQDTKSSYFTNIETINLCRDTNGTISVSELLQKLQIEPKKEFIESNGGEKEIYVSKYVLTAYVYQRDPDNYGL